MGFVRERKVFKLVFDDPDMAGLEVRARSLPLDGLMEIAKMADLAGVEIKTVPTAEQMGILDGLFQRFASVLIDWNLEEDPGDGGPPVPVPATLEGLHSQDMDFVLTVVMAWIEAVAGVAAPKGPRSPSGVTFPEGSLPMEALSQNPLSSLMPG